MPAKSSHFTAPNKKNWPNDWENGEELENRLRARITRKHPTTILTAQDRNRLESKYEYIQLHRLKRTEGMNKKGQMKKGDEQLGTTISPV
ncbi:MAG: hypothetical protein C0507_15885 [Cyanobacteria bacterium PR.3.49]|nr:hypothetical protein [Cyanobacteria bacterium PR.3.49]